MTESEGESHDRSFYRVPCELQIRFKVLDAKELEVFKSFSLRPSAYASLRSDIERQIQSLSIREESKTLFEKAFQILINLDQRLERIEDQIQQLSAGAAHGIAEHYEWIHGDLGAGGLSFKPAKAYKQIARGNHVLIDVILPSMPEYRFVGAAEVVHLDADGRLGLHFVAIHEDDKEFIHRFVVAREREILRARALERDKNKKE